MLEKSQKWEKESIWEKKKPKLIQRDLQCYSKARIRYDYLSGNFLNSSLKSTKVRKQKKPEVELQGFGWGFLAFILHEHPTVNKTLLIKEQKQHLKIKVLHLEMQSSGLMNFSTPFFLKDTLYHIWTSQANYCQVRSIKEMTKESTEVSFQVHR